MYAETFASRLQNARQEAGLSQREAADKLKISKSTIASYEMGRTQPDIETLGRLAALYNVSIDWLVGIKGKNT